MANQYAELTDDEVAEHIKVYGESKSLSEAARKLGINRDTFRGRINRISQSGKLGPELAKPGFAIKTYSKQSADGTWVKFGRESGPNFEPPQGLVLRGATALVDGDNQIIQQHLMYRADGSAMALSLEAAVKSASEKLPRVKPVNPPKRCNNDLLNFYCVTDLHFGSLAWGEETRGDDYDLGIAEKLLLDWFSAAIGMAPDAHTGVFAQLGDLLHYDGLTSITPTSHHILDTDSRFQKMIRVVIRSVRQVISMLLQKHQHVHVIMASGNHDPAGSAWLRELLPALYENEPRVTIDSTPSLYYNYEWGETGLYAHHGHKRNVKSADQTVARLFREQYGRCKFNYLHLGHLHHNSRTPPNSALMDVEMHETLAAPDNYAASGGWLSNRSAKVITYSKKYGEVFRSTLSPEMVGSDTQ